MQPSSSSTTPDSAGRAATRGRDRWRTIRTITCELQALTGPAMPGSFGRPLAGPEAVVELPRFQGHMLHAPLLPVTRKRVVSMSAPVVPLPAVAPAPAIAPVPARSSWLLPLVLFASTGFAIGWLIALASG